MSGSILDLIEDGDEEQARPGRPRQADQLVRMALERYSFGVSKTGDTYGIATDGPRIARLMRGSAASIRADLAKRYYMDHGRAPSSTSLADAMAVLQGFASCEEPTDLHIRYAAADGVLWIDLGDTTGRVIRVSADGWRIEDETPVLFRRSELTGTFMEPVPGGSLDELRDFLNVDDAAWRLVAGWLVSAFFPDIPHPILVLQGEQGTGKTAAGRILGSLVDPSPAPLRTAPRDVGEWITVADGAYLVAFDNLSGLSGWLSDALCRAVTGDGLARRKLYSDSDLVVSSFRRLILMTGIDFGALSADLIDRSLFVELERIAPEARRLDSQITRDFTSAYPRILGGLLDLVSATMRELPHTTLDSFPRMADHALILAALDEATEDVHLACYEQAAGRAMAEAADGDSVAEAVLMFMQNRATWTGTASALMESITPRDVPKRWPPTAHHLSGQMKRLGPVLRARGVEVEHIRTHEGRAIVLTSVTHDAGDAQISLSFSEKEESNNDERQM